MRSPCHCLIPLILKGRIYYGTTTNVIITTITATTTATTSATTIDIVISFWKLSALECRLEISDILLCLTLTSKVATVLPLDMHRRLMPPVEIVVY